MPAALPDGEDNEHGPPVTRPANGPEPALDLRMARVGQDDDRAGEQSLDLGPGNAVFPAMLKIAVIPLESRNKPSHN